MPFTCKPTNPKPKLQTISSLCLSYYQRQYSLITPGPSTHSWRQPRPQSPLELLTLASPGLAYHACPILTTKSTSKAPAHTFPTLNLLQAGLALPRVILLLLRTVSNKPSFQRQLPPDGSPHRICNNVPTFENISPHAEDSEHGAVGHEHLVLCIFTWRAERERGQPLTYKLGL